MDWMEWTTLSRRPSLYLALISFDIKGIQLRPLPLLPRLYLFQIKVKEFRDGEVQPFIKRPRQGGSSPVVLSSHPTETLIHYHFTLVVVLKGWLLPSLFFFVSVHPLFLPAPLLSGTARLRVCVAVFLGQLSCFLMHILDKNISHYICSHVIF